MSVSHTQAHKLDLIDMKCMPLKPSTLWSYIVLPEFRTGLDREL